MPATFYTVVSGTDIYWRAELPTRAIGATLRRIPAEQFELRMLRPKKAGSFPWFISDGNGGSVQPPDTEYLWEHWDDARLLFRYPRHEGTAVFTRPCHLRARHALAMSDQGITTVAELDDTLLSPTHLNLFMKQNQWTPAHREAHLRVTACFDRVVFSTDRLRDSYVAAFRKELPKNGAVLPDTFVCRNNASLEDWPERDEGDGRLRVGWMGSPQHARDIKLAAKALLFARENGCETVMIGHDVRDEAGIRGERALLETRAWRKIISRHVPWKAPGKYHRTALPLDIGLAPLELNEHTLGKSDVKAVEYVMSGALPVLQNHPVYSDHWRHNETCLLAGSPDEFVRCVDALIRSPSLRRRILSAAVQYVREERSDRQTREEWEAAVAT